MEDIKNLLTKKIIKEEETENLEGKKLVKKRRKKGRKISARDIGVLLALKTT